MAKIKMKSKRNTTVKDLVGIELRGLLESAKEYMLHYGALTVENRALPDYRDGCKPVHRRILFAAYIAGRHNDKPFVKSSRMVGDTIGNFHPHGESSIYGALVNLVNLAEPMFTGHGNWGSPDGDDAAAPRYTECRLSKFADEYLLDPNYMAVIPTVENYDGTCTEPVYLPSKLPNVLITGAEGIAMGCTTLIPTYSKDSVIELVKQVLKSKKLTCTPKMCYDTLEFKFADGGLDYNDEEDLMEYYKIGEGKLHFVPEVELTDKNKIRIVSLCPRLKPSKIYDTAADIDGIKDCKNIHGKNCSDWAELTPSNKNLSKKQLQQLMEEVQETYITALSCKTLVTERHDDGTTVTFRRTTIPNIVTDWVKWRIDFEIKVVERLVKLEQTKMQRLKWLIWAIDHLELVFKALKTKDPDGYLVKQGKITDEHAKYILDQQTRRLSKLSGEELQSKVTDCKKYIANLKSQVDNKNNVAKRIYASL